MKVLLLNSWGMNVKASPLVDTVKIPDITPVEKIKTGQIRDRNANSCVDLAGLMRLR
jgi:hypothetical protein